MNRHALKNDGWGHVVHLLAATLIVIILQGCDSPQPATPKTATTQAYVDPASVPEFTLKLRRASKDNRFTNFAITSKGFLSYAAGQTAMIGEVNPVRMLTASERARIVAIVDQYKMEEASNSFFKKSRKVEYIFSFNRGLLGVTIRNVDEESPGFKELHDLLMEYQADGR